MPGKKAGGAPRKHKPTAAVSKQRVGKVEEDGSFRVKGGGVYDPDTGRVRKKRT